MSKEKRPMAEDFEGDKLPYPPKQSEMKQPDSDLSNFKPAVTLKDKVVGKSEEN